MVFQLQGTSRTQALPSDSSFPPSGRRSRSCMPRTCQREQDFECCTPLRGPNWVSLKSLRSKQLSPWSTSSSMPAYSARAARLAECDMEQAQTLATDNPALYDSREYVCVPSCPSRSLCAQALPPHGCALRGCCRPTPTACLGPPAWRKHTLFEPQPDGHGIKRIACKAFLMLNSFISLHPALCQEVHCTAPLLITGQGSGCSKLRTGSVTCNRAMLANAGAALMRLSLQ